MLSALWEHGKPQIQWGLVVLASLAAAFIDVRRRRIPNWLTLPLWAGGLAWAGVWAGPSALANSVLASLLLAAPYVWLYVVAGGGAGDAKLMAALGAWLGIINGLVLLAAVSVSAVLIGVAISLRRRRAATTPPTCPPHSGGLCAAPKTCLRAGLCRTLPLEGG